MPSPGGVAFCSFCKHILCIRKIFAYEKVKNIKKFDEYINTFARFGGIIVLKVKTNKFCFTVKAKTLPIF